MVISCNSNSFYLKGIDSIKIELLRSNGNFSLSFGNITALSINYDAITPQYNFKIATSSLVFTRSAVTFSLTNSSTTSIIFKTVPNSNFSSPLFAMNYKGIQANGPTCNYSFGFNTLTVDGLGWNFGNQCLFTNSIGKSAGAQCVLPNKSGTLALTSDIGNLRVLKNQSEDSIFVYTPALEFRGTTLISIHTSPFMPDSSSTYVCFY